MIELQKVCLQQIETMLVNIKIFLISDQLKILSILDLFC
jgi:hypothetical protein